MQRGIHVCKEVEQSFWGRGPRWRSGNDQGANGDESDVDFGLDQQHFSTETTSAGTSESDQAMSRYGFSRYIQLSRFANSG